MRRILVPAALFAALAPARAEEDTLKLAIGQRGSCC
jgi:hypothetical protein